MSENKSGNIGLYILILSVAIPGIVAALFYLPGKNVEESSWVYLLPHLNAVINTSTMIMLITGFVFIRSGNIEAHKKSMVSAFFLGVLFLIFYILYHASAESTIYGDLDRSGVLDSSEAEGIGAWRTVYLAVLLSHILMAVIVVPFVLFAFYFALSGKIDRHKRTVKFTLPLWLYVSISGVVVYLMISPYYG